MGELVRIEGLNLDCSSDDGEPRVRDIDLAERLGYERPRKIRELIDRLIVLGKLNDSDVRPTVGRTKIGIAERSVTEYWLTEEQALYVVAKSETAMADEILKLVIRVFTLARKGKLPAANSELSALRSEVGQLRADLSKVLTQLGKANEGLLFANSGDLRDSSRFREHVKARLWAIAKAHGVHWNKVHGWMRKEFNLAGYTRLPLSFRDSFEVWANECVGKGRAGTLTIAPAQPPLSDSQQTVWSVTVSVEQSTPEVPELEFRKEVRP